MRITLALSALCIAMLAGCAEQAPSPVAADANQQNANKVLLTGSRLRANNQAELPVGSASGQDWKANQGQALQNLKNN